MAKRISKKKKESVITIVSNEVETDSIIDKMKVESELLGTNVFLSKSKSDNIKPDSDVLIVFCNGRKIQSKAMFKIELAKSRNIPVIIFKNKNSVLEYFDGTYIKEIIYYKNNASNIVASIKGFLISLLLDIEKSEKISNQICVYLFTFLVLANSD